MRTQVHATRDPQSHVHRAIISPIRLNTVKEATDMDVEYVTGTITPAVIVESAPRAPLLGLQDPSRYQRTAQKAFRKQGDPICDIMEVVAT